MGTGELIALSFVCSPLYSQFEGLSFGQSSTMELDTSQSLFVLQEVVSKIYFFVNYYISYSRNNLFRFTS